VLTGVSASIVPENRPTIAHLLKDNSYATGFVGKWHLGWDWAKLDSTAGFGTGWNPEDYDNIDFAKPVTDGPPSKGFDYSFAIAGSLDMAPYVYVENKMPTAIPNRVTVDRGSKTWWREGPTAPDFEHLQTSPVVFEKAKNFIRQHQNQPFFLQISLPSPHTPILPLPEWLGKSGLNEYADFVMQIDAHIGTLMKMLTEQGLAENTLVILSSDNGCSPQANFEELADKGHFPSYIYRGHKADIYEGGTRVPLILNWPGIIAEDSRSDIPVSLADLYATFADILGINLKDSEAEDSFSLMPLVSPATESSYARQNLVTSSINGTFAIRKGNLKLILGSDSGGWSNPIPTDSTAFLPPYQLYDLSTDPGEKVNLAAARPDVVNTLSNALISIIKQGGSRNANNPGNDSVTAWPQTRWIDDL
jgi:arylsulfatase A-like enzyme